jgi:uncharacterized protein (DUF1015 family)
VAIVAPFRGLLYSASRVPDLERVLAPPTDTLQEETLAALRARSSSGVVHLEAPEGEGAARHARAADLLAAWKRDGILEQDERPAFYVAAIKYRARGMPDRTLWGLMARLRLEDEGSPGVTLLEEPDAAARQERLELGLALRTHVAPVVALFPDAAGDVSRTLEEVGRRPPDRWASDDAGMDLRLWRVADRGLVRSLGLALEPRPVWIVDGVDRYAGARDLRDRLRSSGAAPSQPGGRSWDHALAFLTALESPGLTLAPYHRVLKGTRRLGSRSLAGGHAAALFDVKNFSFESFDHRGEQIRRRLREAASRGRLAIAVYAGGADFSLYLLSDEVPEEALASLPEALRHVDVAVLEATLLAWARGMTHAEDEAASVRLADSVEKAMAWVDAGDGNAAFLLNAPGRDRITSMAGAGVMLPHRSICLLPRVPSGLVLDPLDPPDDVHALPPEPEPAPADDEPA